MQSAIHDMQVRIDSLVEESNSKSNIITGLNTSLEKEQKQYKEKIELLQSAEQNLKLTFENLANKILENKSKSFDETQKMHLDQVLKPLRETTRCLPHPR